MAKIAILGFGTVGSGVYEVLCRNAAGVSLCELFVIFVGKISLSHV